MGTNVKTKGKLLREILKTGMLNKKYCVPILWEIVEYKEKENSMFKRDAFLRSCKCMGSVRPLEYLNPFEYI